MKNVSFKVGAIFDSSAAENAHAVPVTKLTRAMSITTEQVKSGGSPGQLGKPSVVLRVANTCNGQIKARPVYPMQYGAMKRKLQSARRAELQIAYAKIRELEARVAAMQGDDHMRAVLDTRSTKAHVRIEIQTVSRQDTSTSDPKVKAVVEKLLSYKDKIEYQTAKGRAAKPVDEWIQSTFIDSEIMTVEELKLVPLWAYRQFNHRLYNAIFNKKRAKPR